MKGINKALLFAHNRKGYLEFNYFIIQLVLSYDKKLRSSCPRGAHCKHLKLQMIVCCDKNLKAMC